MISSDNLIIRDKTKRNQIEITLKEQLSEEMMPVY